MSTHHFDPYYVYRVRSLLYIQSATEKVYQQKFNLEVVYSSVKLQEMGFIHLLFDF